MKFYKKKWFKVVIILLLFSWTYQAITDEDQVEEKTEIVEATEEQQDAGIEAAQVDESEELDTTIVGDVLAKTEGDKIIVTVATNAMDGSIFETSITDANLNIVSDFITVENGEAIKEFDIPEEWEIGYVSAMAMMRFNLDEHPQPDHVKEAYGENGENLEGDFITENNLGGNNINLEIVTVAYPDQETVLAKQDDLFWELMNELKDTSDDIIVNIQPRFTDGDWSSVAVTVSDAWYYSQEYEKERFAEQVGETIKAIVINTERVDTDTSVSVYFYDTYQKELASPKILGGYKIKN